MEEAGIQQTAKPMTEEEATRMKQGKGEDDEDPDAVKNVGSVNPVGDFKKMISDRKTDRVASAMRQIQTVIERYIRSSLNGDLYEKAWECLQQLRAAGISEDEAPTFNKFMEKIKDNYASGPHAGFFKMIVDNKFSLITKAESEISSIVTKSEA